MAAKKPRTTNVDARNSALYVMDVGLKALKEIDCAHEYRYPQAVVIILRNTTRENGRLKASDEKEN